MATTKSPAQIQTDEQIGWHREIVSALQTKAVQAIVASLIVLAAQHIFNKTITQTEALAAVGAFVAYAFGTSAVTVAHINAAARLAEVRVKAQNDATFADFARESVKTLTQTAQALTPQPYTAPPPAAQPKAPPADSSPAAQ